MRRLRRKPFAGESHFTQKSGSEASGVIMSVECSRQAPPVVGGGGITYPSPKTMPKGAAGVCGWAVWPNAPQRLQLESEAKLTNPHCGHFQDAGMT